jgi:CRP-like cAMP-binding protein
MRTLAPELTDADVNAGFALCLVRTLTRGEHLLRAGERATEVAVVVTGLLREHFVLPDGVERTKAFIAPHAVSGSLADLLSSAPSRAFIVAEEPARLLVAPYADYRALASRLPAWERAGRCAVERLLLAKAEREYELLGLDAAQRYAAFTARYPDLEARVAARHVASYLGITPVHLSRLRRRRRAASLRSSRAR